MGKTVNIQYAKSKFAHLIADVEAGAEVVITRAGMPVAKLVPIARRPKRPTRRNLAAALKGKIKIGPDFDDPLPDDILAAFNGEGD